MSGWFKGHGALGAALLTGTLLLAACSGEDRPQVEVIGGEGSVSVSDIEPEPGFSNPASNANRYTVANNVDPYFALGADLRDIREALDQTPVDWTAAAAIFENGKNQILANGSVRALASIPNDAVHAVFLNGASVYGRTDFINGIVRDGLAGAGKAAGLPDAARRELVEGGVQMLLYGKALQEFGAAKTRLEAGPANAGSPVDETWAIVAGPTDGTIHPHALLHTADEREVELRLQNMLVVPFEAVMIVAQQAAQKGDLTAFNQAYPEAVGYINSIFYLSVLRAAADAGRDTDANARQAHLTEGWAYWQTIRALVSGASPASAQAIEGAFNQTPAQPFTSASVSSIYTALNDTAVLRALGIPSSLVIRTAPTQ